MRDELRRTWEAWHQSVTWPRVAAVTPFLVLIGVAGGGGAVHGDTFSRLALVPGVLGIGYLVVALPRQTLPARLIAVAASLYLGRYVFGTPPPGREDTPPSLFLNPMEFYAVHETLVCLAVLLVIAEAAGTWLVRPRAGEAGGTAKGGWSITSPQRRPPSDYGNS